MCAQVWVLACACVCVCVRGCECIPVGVPVGAWVCVLVRAFAGECLCVYPCVWKSSRPETRSVYISSPHSSVAAVTQASGLRQQRHHKSSLRPLKSTQIYQVHLHGPERDTSRGTNSADRIYLCFLERQKEGGRAFDSTLRVQMMQEVPH